MYTLTNGTWLRLESLPIFESEYSDAHNKCKCDNK